MCAQNITFLVCVLYSVEDMCFFSIERYRKNVFLQIDFLVKNEGTEVLFIRSEAIN